MTDLWNLLPASGCERLAADAVWQSTVIAGSALIVVWLFRRRPALRAAILLSAAALALTVPLLSAVVRLRDGGLLAPPIRAAVRSASDPSTPNVATTTDSVESAAIAGATARRPQSDSAGHPWPWLLGCWLAASSYLALRLVRRRFMVRRWIRLATPCHDPQIEAALSRAARALGIGPPELLWSSAFDSPALVALGRARLLLPREMPAGVDWFTVFCHELAHRARRDNVSRLVFEVSLIALPWQPLLWQLRRSSGRRAKKPATTGPWPPGPIRSSSPRCWFRLCPSTGQPSRSPWPKVRRPRGSTSCGCWP